MRFFIVFILTVLCLYSFGQDTTSEINKKWIILKSQFQKRSEIITVLTKTLSKFQADKGKTIALKKASDQLSNQLDRVRLVDSLAISIVEARNNNLVIALQNILLAIEMDHDFIRIKRFVYFQMQLEGCENRIADAANDYNDICRKYGKSGFIFHKTNKNELAEVKL